MGILSDHFYHKTISLYTGVMGEILNDIKIKRASDGKLIKVPIAYSGQEKQNNRLRENEDPDALRYKMRLPRLGFRLVGWDKDDTRVTNRNYVIQSKGDRQLGVNSQLNRVPYNFTFEVSAKTKNMDDLLQIVEQVIVYFNPAIQVVVKDNPTMDDESALTIRLDSSSMNDQFEGIYEDSRILDATFNFTLEGWLYMPTSEASIIKTVHVNYFDINFTDTLIDADTYTE